MLYSTLFFCGGSLIITHAHTALTAWFDLNFLFLDRESFWDSPILFMSALTQSHQVFLAQSLSINARHHHLTHLASSLMFNVY